MDNFTVSDALSACGGRLCGAAPLDAALGAVVIDSRLVRPGDLFVASSAIRTPFLSAGMCFATISIATLQRKRFVPIPAVAVMPVVSSTSRMIFMARSCAESL